MMSLRDKTLAKFKSNRSPARWDYYKGLRNQVSYAINHEKKNFFKYHVDNSSSDMWKKLYQFNIINRKRTPDIPPHLRDVNAINQNFLHSIPVLQPDLQLLESYRNSTKFADDHVKFTFNLVSPDDVSSILGKLRSNAIGIDDINLELLKLCGSNVIPIITHIVNSCILSNHFPDKWKHAVVTPLGKVSRPTEFKHLRPISILPVMSKILEKVMKTQIEIYLNSFEILPSYQSGFRAHHSCETALLSITDDVISATDKNLYTALILLDFTKAFDTLNHELLLSILNYLGFAENAISFIKSYLSGRTQAVSLNKNISSFLPCSLGVSQGSVLGPLFYTIYTSQLFDAIKTCKYHAFADDTQIYYSFSKDSMQEANLILNDDLTSLIKSATDHCLVINPLKSTVMLFGRPKHYSVVSEQLQLSINGAVLNCVNSARNLGLILDNRLKFNEHVTKGLCKAYSTLKILYANKNSLPSNLKVQLTDSLVLSNLSYCSSVYGPFLDVTNQRRIQCLQNSCLRFIFNIKRSCHISHTLKWANWLNMANRRRLRSLVLFNKILTIKAPLYLFERGVFRSSLHTCDTRYKHHFSVPAHNTSLFKASFSYNISKFYESLPLCLRSHSSTSSVFKLRLKEHLLEIQ